MPRPKVYREYFPTCVERFFGGGKPRRIKARCFVPYTEMDENTNIFLGPDSGAPNIDLNMTVNKGARQMIDVEKYAAVENSEEDAGSGALHEVTSAQKMDCGCKCRCESSSSTNSSSCSSSSSSSSCNKTTRRPKVLVLEEDGRYREINEECAGVHRALRKNTVKKAYSSSVKSAKLVMKETKIDVICPSMASPVSTSPPGSDVFTWDECRKITACPEPQDGGKKGVVLGYVMFDPDSDDKRLYVTTTEGKRITPS